MPALKDTNEVKEYSGLKIVERKTDANGIAMPDMQNDAWYFWSPSGKKLSARKQQLVRAGWYRLGQACKAEDPALVDLADEDGYIWLSEEICQTLADIAEVYTNPKEFPYHGETFAKFLTKLAKTYATANKHLAKAGLFEIHFGFRLKEGGEPEVTGDEFASMF